MILPQSAAPPSDCTPFDEYQVGGGGIPRLRPPGRAASSLRPSGRSLDYSMFYYIMIYYYVRSLILYYSSIIYRIILASFLARARSATFAATWSHRFFPVEVSPTGRALDWLIEARPFQECPISRVFGICPESLLFSPVRNQQQHQGRWDSGGARERKDPLGSFGPYYDYYYYY